MGRVILVLDAVTRQEVFYGVCHTDLIYCNRHGNVGKLISMVKLKVIRQNSLPQD